MAVWEYKVESINISERWSPKKQQAEIERFEGELNAIGVDGWEMVNYQAVPLTGAVSGSVKGYAYLALFKRQQT